MLVTIPGVLARSPCAAHSRAGQEEGKLSQLTGREILRAYTPREPRAPLLPWSGAPTSKNPGQVRTAFVRAMRVADSRCQVYWKNIQRRAGWVLPVGRHVPFDLYFDFGNDTGRVPTASPACWPRLTNPLFGEVSFSAARKARGRCGPRTLLESRERDHSRACAW